MSVIERLRELEAKATPGPWTWDGPVWDYDKEQEAPWLMGPMGTAGALPHMSPKILHGEIEAERESDARLITAMRSALPLLLRVAEAADRMTPGADDWHWSDSMRDELHAAVRALRSEP